VKYALLPLDIHEVKDTKNSFKKLIRICCQSTASNEFMNEIKQQINSKKQSRSNRVNNHVSNKSEQASNPKYSLNNKSNGKKAGSSLNYQSSFNANQSNNPTSSTAGFYKLLQESKWFEQIQLIINIGNLIADRINEASSVMVSLEDGWDLTAQVVSLAELLLDPFYRTFIGFNALIEREWLSMGHRFGRRSNQTVDDQTGFAPIFLQFLDIVHQCMQQYPNAFEFNEFYLEFLAYHHVSNRFKTFLLDSELERVQYGLINSTTHAENTYLNRNLNFDLHTNVTYSMISPIPASTTCIWQYILKCHYNSARFFNFNYQANAWQTIRMSSDLSNLKLWDYYIKESLCTGPLYDLDLINIGNLNCNPSSSSSNANNIASGSMTNVQATCTTADDIWYPVPVQHASDYYEQLDQILPTQYELLLKQIMRKYRLSSERQEQMNAQSVSSPTSLKSSPSASSISQASYEFLNKLLSTNPNESALIRPANIEINWKNVWDYFYRTVIIFLFFFESLQLSGMLNQILAFLFFICLKVENKFVKENCLKKGNNLINSNSISLSGFLSSTRPDSPFDSTKPYLASFSQLSNTPPFPKVTHSNKYSHEFELTIFSSTQHCNHCGGTFKSSTQYTGLKCRNCLLSYHEQCVNDFNIQNDCVGSNILSDVWASIEQNPNEPLGNVQLDTSSYSIQSSSSCSTTPNSNYSQSKYLSNGGKLDADIGSAMGKFHIY
jgi:hypothetical protein